MLTRVLIKWAFGVIANLLIAFCLAFTFQFPLWIVLVTVIILEGVPLLWMSGAIAPSLYIDRYFIEGFWGILQFVVFLFYAVNTPRLIMSLTLEPIWTTLLMGMFIPAILFFVFYRVRSMRDFLDQKKLKDKLILLGFYDLFKNPEYVMSHGTRVVEDGSENYTIKATIPSRLLGNVTMEAVCYVEKKMAVPVMILSSEQLTILHDNNIFMITRKRKLLTENETYLCIPSRAEIEKIESI